MALPSYQTRIFIRASFGHWPPGEQAIQPGLHCWRPLGGQKLRCCTNPGLFMMRWVHSSFEVFGLWSCQFYDMSIILLRAFDAADSYLSALPFIRTFCNALGGLRTHLFHVLATTFARRFQALLCLAPVSYSSYTHLIALYKSSFCRKH